MSYRLDHIALLVGNLDESVRFYTDVLRLTEVPNPMGGTDFRWIEIGDNQRFHLQQGDISKVHVEKQTHFALTTDDLDGMLDHLRSKGAAFSDMKGTPGGVNVRPDGMRAVFLEDPNGYWIEINNFVNNPSRST